MSSGRWQRIDDVFHQAVDLVPEARSAFLDEACVGDESLRKEVASLLAHDVEEGNTLANAVQAESDEIIHAEDLTGKSVGPYQVLERIGAGGMGTVFKAMDTRLNRTVAIKVCAAEFSGHFIHEARAVAALNHPHVCTLYDVSVNYLVMELVEGQPLKGPLRVEKVVEYAGQILDALDAAHRKGITHRDLKPANILVTKRGIKLLDFGLARQDGDAAPGARIGEIAGTLHYMAPEQLQGKDADARSDVFAFGCVLYELLSGKRAFDDSSSTRGVDTLPECQPPALDRVVRTCLASDPDHRFQTAVDLKRAIEWSTSGAGAQRPPSRLRPWHGIVAGLTTAAALALIAVKFLSVPQEGPLTTFTVFPEEKSALTGHVAIAPDGRRITFVARDSAGSRHLWLRTLDSAEMRRLPGTEGAYFPAWSPDGQWIGFSNPYQLKKIEVASGQVLTVADTARMVRGLAWSRDGMFVFGTQGGPIRRVTAAGGVPEPVTAIDGSHGEVEHEYPSLLPDGKHLLFFVNSRQEGTNGVWMASLGKPADHKRLLPDTSAAMYASGFLLFVRGSALMAQRFNPDRGEFGGPPESVAPKIGYSRSGDGAFAASASGVLAWSPVFSLASNAHLTWFDRSGVRLGDVGPARQYNSVSLSPDGKRIAASDLGTTLPIVILDPGRDTTNYFRRGGAGMNPVWSPDGSQIAYGALRRVRELFVQSSTGATEAQPLLENGKPKSPTGWSLDGRYLLYQEMAETGQWTIWSIAINGDRKAERLVSADFHSSNAQFSPDGRWIAYASTESQVQQVYIQSFPSGRGKWQVSTDGGDQPRWRHDGKELFYVHPLGKMMSVELKSRDTLEPGPPRILFKFRGSNNPYGTFRYDVTADGRKFLILTPDEDTSFDPLHVVLNWTAGLKHQY